MVQREGGPAVQPVQAAVETQTSGGGVQNAFEGAAMPKAGLRRGSEARHASNGQPNQVTNTAGQPGSSTASGSTLTGATGAGATAGAGIANPGAPDQGGRPLAVGQNPNSGASSTVKPNPTLPGAREIVSQRTVEEVTTGGARREVEVTESRDAHGKFRTDTRVRDAGTPGDPRPDASRHDLSRDLKSAPDASPRNTPTPPPGAEGGSQRSDLAQRVDASPRSIPAHEGRDSLFGSAKSLSPEPQKGGWASERPDSRATDRAIPERGSDRAAQSSDRGSDKLDSASRLAERPAEARPPLTRDQPVAREQTERPPVQEKTRLHDKEALARPQVDPRNLVNDQKLDGQKPNGSPDVRPAPTVAERLSAQPSRQSTPPTLEPTARIDPPVKRLEAELRSPPVQLPLTKPEERFVRHDGTAPVKLDTSPRTVEPALRGIERAAVREVQAKLDALQPPARKEVILPQAVPPPRVEPRVDRPTTHDARPPAPRQESRPDVPQSSRVAQTRPTQAPNEPPVRARTHDANPRTPERVPERTPGRAVAPRDRSGEPRPAAPPGRRVEEQQRGQIAAHERTGRQSTEKHTPRTTEGLAARGRTAEPQERITERPILRDLPGRKGREPESVARAVTPRGSEQIARHEHRERAAAPAAQSSRAVEKPARAQNATAQPTPRPQIEPRLVPEVRRLIDAIRFVARTQNDQIARELERLKQTDPRVARVIEREMARAAQGRGVTPELKVLRAVLQNKTLDAKASPLTTQFTQRALVEMAQRIVELLKILPQNALTKSTIKALERMVERLTGLKLKLSDEPTALELQQLRELRLLMDRAVKKMERDLLRRERDLQEQAQRERDGAKLTERAAAELIDGIMLATDGPFAADDDRDEGIGALQVHRISGRVYSRRTGLPIAGVVVQGGALGYQVTGIYGEFTFENVPTGTPYSLVLSKPRHQFSPGHWSGKVSISSVHHEAVAVVEPN